MKTRLFAGVLGACLVLAPLTVTAADDNAKPKAAKQVQDSDMQKAIAFERHKDEAAARQARIEAKHPTVFYDNADRAATPGEATQSRKVVPKSPHDKQ